MPPNPLIPPKRNRIRKPNKLRRRLHESKRIIGMAGRFSNSVRDAGDPQDDVEDRVGVEEHGFFDGAGALPRGDLGGCALFFVAVGRLEF